MRHIFLLKADKSGIYLMATMSAQNNSSHQNTKLNIIAVTNKYKWYFIIFNTFLNGGSYDIMYQYIKSSNARRSDNIIIKIMKYLYFQNKY